jgi:hypothetical protein
LPRCNPWLVLFFSELHNEVNNDIITFAASGSSHAIVADDTDVVLDDEYGTAEDSISIESYAGESLTLC